MRRIAAWLGVAATMAVQGCALEARLAGKRCDASHECVAGFTCVDGTCRGDEPIDSGPLDAGVADAGVVDGGVVDAGAVDDAGIADADAGPWRLLDERGADFSAGDVTLGTRLSADGEEVVLDDGRQVGSFISRELVVGVDAELRELRWRPRAPYGKPLPDNSSSDAEVTTYAAGGLDLEGLVFLLHADGADALFDGALLPESTGRAHPVQLVDLDTPADALYVPGVFGTALFLPRADYLRITDADTHEDFAFADGTFTWSGWARIDGCDASDDNVILLGGERPHVWFGANCSAGVAHATIIDDALTSAGVSSTVDIIDNRWHHLALVKHDNPDVAILYVDGREAARREDTSWGSFSNFTKELFIGNFPIGTAPGYNYASELTVDEIAVFRRPLTSEEVRGLWARGALALSLQLRACPAAGCGGVAFVGPDGTPATSFAEPLAPAQPTLPPPYRLLSGLFGRRFQYRATLSSNDVALSPALDMVELLIEPQ